MAELLTLWPERDLQLGQRPHRQLFAALGTFFPAAVRSKVVVSTVANKPKILKRVLLDEVVIGAAHYVLCYEVLRGKRARAVIMQLAWKNLSDRVHAPIIWKSRPRKAPESLPCGSNWWGTDHCRVGRKALYGIVAQLLADTRLSFRIRGGWQFHDGKPFWTEEKFGDVTTDSITGWRRRCTEKLQYHLGNWEPKM